MWVRLPNEICQTFRYSIEKRFLLYLPKVSRCCSCSLVDLRSLKKGLVNNLESLLFFHLSKSSLSDQIRDQTAPGLRTSY